MRKSIYRLIQPSLYLGLSPTAVSLVSSSGLWKKTRHLTAVMSAKTTADTSMVNIIHCETVLNEHADANQAIIITLSDEWARYFLVTPPKNARRLEDLKTAAAMRFQQLYGDSAQSWHLQGDWDSTSPFLVCALPRSLLSALRHLVDQKRLRLLALQPQFIARWNRSMMTKAPPAWVAVTHQQKMTIAATSKNSERGIDAIESVTLPLMGTSFNWLHDQLDRMALRNNLPSPERCQVFDDQERSWVISPSPSSIVIQSSTHPLPAWPGSVNTEYYAIIRLAVTGLHT